ncbi:VanW family protein [Clostridium sp. 'White wine YQ']|uniref:VanW family protein n=1 Tax=Clostridium sp. 'White wine YQ' TaxID=3027474 RepID=UPI002366BA16|nr:VanW family protein [Clostridium sp. 'White wine YQ']MDD7793157.1 VanW family protein [Clostridium sp. 'White wine YQ']
MGYIERKPINRSKLRLYFGKRYYDIKRFIEWHFSNKKFSKHLNEELYQNIIFQHRTPLLRKLKGVDMGLQINKIQNLKIATKKINGLVIKPGETFSYWKLIGRLTYKKGYLDGLVLYPDGTFKAGVGGGLCQLSNLIYWMTLHTPLIVTERHRHSHDIFPDSNRTQPFGSGATCSYSSLDLQIFNGTNSDFQLVVYLTKDELVGEWRSSESSMLQYEVYEKEHSITPGLWGGYIRNNTIYRKVYDNIGFIKDEYITENHAYMTYNPYLNGMQNVN